MGEFKMGQLHCLGTKQGGAGVVVLWQQEISKSPDPFDLTLFCGKRVLAPLVTFLLQLNLEIIRNIKKHSFNIASSISRAY